MKKFMLHWRGTGSPTEIVTGNTIAEAMTLAGYSSGAVRALDYFEEIAGEPEAAAPSEGVE